jgi:hypothetical protein
MLRVHECAVGGHVAEAMQSGEIQKGYVDMAGSGVDASSTSPNQKAAGATGIGAHGALPCILDGSDSGAAGAWADERRLQMESAYTRNRMDYLPPSPEDRQRLKTELGYSSGEMAELACVGAEHWRKYTGGSEPRRMAYANLFHLAAKLVLTADELERVRRRMREIGATLDDVP